MKVLSTRVDSGTESAFRALCKREGVEPGVLLRALVVQLCASKDGNAVRLARTETLSNVASTAQQSLRQLEALARHELSATDRQRADGLNDPKARARFLRLRLERKRGNQ
jgi:hypothetical protein